MRTEAELKAKIERLEKEIKTGREILRQWERLEVYPGQLVKQVNFYEAAMGAGLYPLRDWQG